ncbi:DUF4153 domain-containing protein [Rhizobium mayense]|uniref:DUF4173 domain-containing protein n=1 Tax=Rhizobium mayense TaxID=1312184 RepID=A0ABT7JS99_9HYPH|nr:DUF4173 domain-containing protein [Rhizobium mayense]MDL2397819.1 DUF4173 domain-containing protein [Rhizobium mayense]
MTEITEAMPSDHRRRRGGRTAFVLLATIISADFLIYDQTPGINLFYCVLVIAVGIVLMARRFLFHAIFAGLGASVAAAMPLVEAPTAPGMLFALFGLVVLSLSGSGILPPQPTRWPAIFLRFAVIAPSRLLIDVFRLSIRGTEQRILERLSHGAIVWIIPVISAAIFLALFRSANPVIEAVLDKIDLAAVLNLFNLPRALFWLAVAAFVWPLLLPRLKRRRKRTIAVAEITEAARESILFGHASILRSLLIFNALFAVQTLLDLAYLWGGATLPDGMSHADYAHRGAYPLILTALLAAVFVLWAMRRNGPGEQSPLIRNLVYLWIIQNILLCVSSIFRLDLYVDVYALTELRVAAGIWMILVAVGLGLILLRILLHRTNAWLISMNLATLMLVLYTSAFVDFSAVIARFNVEHSLELTGEGMPLDLPYLKDLGPTAIPAIDLYIRSLKKGQETDKLRAMDLRFWMAYEFENRSRTWRSWNYRDNRIDIYIAEHHRAAIPPMGNSDSDHLQ